MPSRLSNLLVVSALGLTFFSQILLAVMGQTGAPIENRPITRFPDFGAENAFDIETWQAIDDVATERLPARRSLIAANAWLDLNVWHDPPSPEILVGEDDWWFLSEGLDGPCLSEREFVEIRREVAAASAIVSQAGGTLRFVIAPSKASIYPEQLGQPSIDLTCFEANRQTMSEQLGSIDGVVLLWDELQAAKSDMVVYFERDSHWNRDGARVAMGYVVDSLGPEVSTIPSVTPGPSHLHTLDIPGLLAFVEEVEAPNPELNFEPQIVWEGETINVADKFVAYAYRVEGQPVLDDQLLFVHDSFGWDSFQYLIPFFSSTVTTNNRKIDHRAFSDHFEPAQTIVYEVTERGVADLIASGNVSERFVNAMIEELNPIPVDLGTDGVIDVGPPRPAGTERYLAMRHHRPNAGPDDEFVTITELGEGSQRNVDPSFPVVSWRLDDEASVHVQNVPAGAEFFVVEVDLAN